MELAVNRKLARITDLFAPREEELIEDTVEECAFFAYKRSLLFYTAECKCCRYATAVKNASGETQYICSCAEKSEAV